MPLRLRNFSFDLWLVILGVAALLALSPIGAVLAVASAISVVGLPITLILAAIPPLFVVLLAFRLAHLALSLAGIRFWAFSAALALAVLAIVPFFENRRLDAAADALISGDGHSLRQAPDMQALAVGSRGLGRGGPACDDLCQRALLRQAVPRIIMFRTRDPSAPPSDAQEGTLYRIEQRETCPPFDIADGQNSLNLPGERRKFGDKSPADLLRLKAAAGACLIAEPATLAEADAVLVTGRIASGQSGYGAGLDPFADTLRAERLSFYVRQDSAWTERYRSTAVTYSRLWPLLLPSYVTGYGLELAAGFLRSTAYRGGSSRFQPAPSLEAFLADVLQLDLTLPDAGGSDALTRQLIASALDRPGSIDRASVKVMDDFLEEIQRRKVPAPGDAELAARILEDRRVPVPRQAAAPVRKFAGDDPQLARRMAGALFARLFEIPADEREDDPTYLGYSVGYLASAIAALPDAAVAPYRAELERLARDNERRVNGYAALRKLAIFGAGSVPTMIYLIDDAPKGEAGKGVQKAWQHPYLAGIQGLCLAGPEAGAAIPLLYERLASGTVVKFGPYWKLAINTLVSLGADPDDMWPHLQTSDRNHTRERFDGVVERARKKADCGF